MKKTIYTLCLASVTTVFILGCGGGDSKDTPDTVSVSGKITLDGKPLPGAEVNFMSEKFAGFGKTGPDGTYKLVQGAVPGQNKITISKWEGEQLSEEEMVEKGLDPAQLEAATEPGAGGKAPEGAPKQLVPEEYSDAEKSKLTFDVPAEGTTSANFDL